MHRFQIAPLWRAFSNGSVFGDRFRRCSVDGRKRYENDKSGRKSFWKRSKTAPLSFENGLVWTGPQKKFVLWLRDRCQISENNFYRNWSVNPVRVFDICWEMRSDSKWYDVLLLLWTNSYYSVCGRDVIKFSNPKLKTHERFYPHQAKEVVNLCLFSTFKLNSVLRLETDTFWISKLWRCVI